MHALPFDGEYIPRNFRELLLSHFQQQKLSEPGVLGLMIIQGISSPGPRWVVEAEWLPSELLPKKIPLAMAPCIHASAVDLIVQIMVRCYR